MSIAQYFPPLTRYELTQWFNRQVFPRLISVMFRLPTATQRAIVETVRQNFVNEASSARWNGYDLAIRSEQLVTRYADMGRRMAARTPQTVAEWAAHYSARPPRMR